LLGRVTISIGVALLRTDDTSQSLIERTDNFLYVVKRQGCDRVICETDPEAEPRTNPQTTPPAQVA
jgi:diguanylate cyclase